MNKEKTRNIILATKLPYESASLIMAIRQGNVTTHAKYIGKGHFLTAMQYAPSVGAWVDSPHGQRWWDRVRTRLEESGFGDYQEYCQNIY